MNCWQCDRPAHGVCQFCGRAACRDHFQKMPFILEIYHSRDGETKAIVVEDSLYCGLCKPHDAPVSLKELD